MLQSQPFYKSECLMAEFLTPEILQSNTWLACRHGRDNESVIDETFNTELTEEGVADSITMANDVTQLLDNSRDTAGNHYNIHHSDKLRAAQTAEILAISLGERDFSVSLHEDTRLNGFNQGRILDPERFTHEQKVVILKKARDAFDLMFRTRRDNSYRFGEAIEGDEQFQTLEGIYPYGETQSEYLDRLYNFLYERILDETESGNIFITHANTASRLHAIVESCHTAIDENELDGLKLPHGKFIRISISDYDLCLSALSRKIAAL